MPKTYTHLCAEERTLIMVERQSGSSLRHVGARLGRSPSTISREIRRVAEGLPYDAAMDTDNETLNPNLSQ